MREIIKYTIVAGLIVSMCYISYDKGEKAGQSAGIEYGMQKGFDFTIDTINKMMDHHVKDTNSVGCVYFCSKTDTVSYYFSNKTVITPEKKLECEKGFATFKSRKKNK